ncbi:MAG: hypothetical protein KJI69_03545 [Patescibacteria group bacterium]|nr:hypothetical protein [Patescibacteria group bacterium]
MTPFIEGKSEPKIPFIYKFSIYKAKTTNSKAREILESFGFTKFALLEDDPIYDFQMRLRLEEHFNAVKFAGDIIKKHNDIFMEIKTEKGNRN